ncbi:hypothetical protein PHYBOEH_005875 [Phytophthora boehmeriae]|uniref:cDENN domain-containing protein n=1 Tax=Phytophthora boehmeriae TaxID=109152 RepID=A0A8T1WQQ5_9STRA|nr:hypothetical protein PHYBOEH_005875 [Phytophthora boehmeriae]
MQRVLQKKKKSSSDGKTLADRGDRRLAATTAAVSSSHAALGASQVSSSSSTGAASSRRFHHHLHSQSQSQPQLQPQAQPPATASHRDQVVVGLAASEDGVEDWSSDFAPAEPATSRARWRRKDSVGTDLLLSDTLYKRRSSSSSNGNATGRNARLSNEVAGSSSNSGSGRHSGGLEREEDDVYTTKDRRPQQDTTMPQPEDSDSDEDWDAEFGFDDHTDSGLGGSSGSMDPTRRRAENGNFFLPNLHEVLDGESLPDDEEMDMDAVSPVVDGIGRRPRRASEEPLFQRRRSDINHSSASVDGSVDGIRTSFTSASASSSTTIEYSLVDKLKLLEVANSSAYAVRIERYPKPSSTFSNLERDRTNFPTFTENKYERWLADLVVPDCSVISHHMESERNRLPPPRQLKNQHFHALVSLPFGCDFVDTFFKQITHYRYFGEDKENRELVRMYFEKVSTTGMTDENWASNLPPHELEFVVGCSMEILQEAARLYGPKPVVPLATHLSLSMLSTSSSASSQGSKTTIYWIQQFQDILLHCAEAFPQYQNVVALIELRYVCHHLAGFASGEYEYQWQLCNQLPSFLPLEPLAGDSASQIVNEVLQYYGALFQHLNTSPESRSNRYMAHKTPVDGRNLQTDDTRRFGLSSDVICLQALIMCDIQSLYDSKSALAEISLPALEELLEFEDDEATVDPILVGLMPHNRDSRSSSTSSNPDFRDSGYERGDPSKGLGGWSASGKLFELLRPSSRARTSALSFFYERMSATKFPLVKAKCASVLAGMHVSGTTQGNLRVAESLAYEALRLLEAYSKSSVAKLSKVPSLRSRNKIATVSYLSIFNNDGLLSDLGREALESLGNILIKNNKYRYGILCLEAAGALFSFLNQGCEYEKLDRLLCKLTLEADDVHRALPLHEKVTCAAQRQGNITVYVYLTQEMTKLWILLRSYCREQQEREWERRRDGDESTRRGRSTFVGSVVSPAQVDDMLKPLGVSLYGLNKEEKQRLHDRMILFATCVRDVDKAEEQALTSFWSAFDLYRLLDDSLHQLKVLLEIISFILAPIQRSFFALGSNMDDEMLKSHLHRRSSGKGASALDVDDPSVMLGGDDTIEKTRKTLLEAQKLLRPALNLAEQVANPASFLQTLIFCSEVWVWLERIASYKSEKHLKEATAFWEEAVRVMKGVFFRRVAFHDVAEASALNSSTGFGNDFMMPFARGGNRGRFCVVPILNFSEGFIVKLETMTLQLILTACQLQQFERVPEEGGTMKRTSSVKFIDLGDLRSLPPGDDFVLGRENGFGHDEGSSSNGAIGLCDFDEVQSEKLWWIFNLWRDAKTKYVDGKIETSEFRSRNLRYLRTLLDAFDPQQIAVLYYGGLENASSDSVVTPGGSRVAPNVGNGNPNGMLDFDVARMNSHALIQDRQLVLSIGYDYAPEIRRQFGTTPKLQFKVFNVREGDTKLWRQEIPRPEWYLSEYDTLEAEEASVGAGVLRTMRLLGAKLLVKLLGVLLLENSVVVVGNSYPQIQEVTTSLLKLLEPFKWQHTFLPFVPVTSWRFLHDAAFQHAQAELAARPKSRRSFSRLSHDWRWGGGSGSATGGSLTSSRGSTDSLNGSGYSASGSATAPSTTTSVGDGEEEPPFLLGTTTDTWQSCVAFSKSCGQDPRLLSSCVVVVDLDDVDALASDKMLRNAVPLPKKWRRQFLERIEKVARQRHKMRVKTNRRHSGQQLASSRGPTTPASASGVTSQSMRSPVSMISQSMRSPVSLASRSPAGAYPQTELRSYDDALSTSRSGSSWMTTPASTGDSDAGNYQSSDPNRLNERQFYDSECAAAFVSGLREFFDKLLVLCVERKAKGKKKKSPSSGHSKRQEIKSWFSSSHDFDAFVDNFQNTEMLESFEKEKAASQAEAQAQARALHQMERQSSEHEVSSTSSGRSARFALSNTPKSLKNSFTPQQLKSFGSFSSLTASNRSSGGQERRR